MIYIFLIFKHININNYVYKSDKDLVKLNHMRVVSIYITIKLTKILLTKLISIKLSKFILSSYLIITV